MLNQEPYVFRSKLFIISRFGVFTYLRATLEVMLGGLTWTPGGV